MIVEHQYAKFLKDLGNLLDSSEHLEVASLIERVVVDLVSAKTVSQIDSDFSSFSSIQRIEERYFGYDFSQQTYHDIHAIGIDIKHLEHDDWWPA